jgi:hypothetical protein
MLEGFVHSKDGRSAAATTCEQLGGFYLIAAFLKVVIENLTGEKYMALDETFREASRRFSAVSLHASPTHIKTTHYNWVMAGCGKDLGKAAARSAMPNLFDEHPGLKAWAMKYTYQHVHHRKKGTPPFSAEVFRKEMNLKFTELIIRSEAADGGDDAAMPPILEWKTTKPALRYLKLLDMHFSPMAQGMCFNHERADVVAARTDLVQLFNIKRKRMHLFYSVDGKEFDVHDPTTIIGTAEGELDRRTLGPFGGQLKEGIVAGDPDPERRPILLWMQDEVIFRSKVEHTMQWHIGKRRRCRSKDMGQGRMLSGFAHEFLGFTTLTDTQFANVNKRRAAREPPDAPLKSKTVDLKPFDYGAKNTDKARASKYWVTDDLIYHVIECMDAWEELFGIDQYVFMICFDHSSNHEAYASDALRAENLSMGWGGAQPLMHATQFSTHHAVLADNIRVAGTSGVKKAKSKYNEGDTVFVKLPWGNESRGKLFPRAGTIASQNGPTHHTPGSYVVDFGEPVHQPMLFVEGDLPISSFSGRGAADHPSSHIGCAKGSYQVCAERGLAPVTIPKCKKRAMSSDARLNKIYDILEGEGRFNTKDYKHDGFCHGCQTDDDIAHNVAVCTAAPEVVVAATTAAAAVVTAAAGLAAATTAAASATKLKGTAKLKGALSTLELPTDGDKEVLMQRLAAHHADAVVRGKQAKATADKMSKAAKAAAKLKKLMIKCTYCNFEWHPACAAGNLTAKESTDCHVVGTWACPGCIKTVEDEHDDLPAKADATDEVTQEGSSVDAQDEAAGTTFGIWSASHMEMLLALEEDFVNQKSRLHEVMEARGHMCVFLPKFHW